MTKDTTYLCTTANGIRIVFDPVHSHTATHFKDAPSLKHQVKNLLGSLVVVDDLIAQEFDMGKIIGDCNVIETDEKDEIIYAIRKNRRDQGYVPFTKSRTSQPCSLISIHLVKKTAETYELSSVWIGEYESPMFPQMENATAESIPYWRQHAFVWGSQEIIPGTELSQCPW